MLAETSYDATVVGIGTRLQRLKIERKPNQLLTQTGRMPGFRFAKTLREGVRRLFRPLSGQHEVRLNRTTRYRSASNDVAARAMCWGRYQRGSDRGSGIKSQRSAIFCGTRRFADELNDICCSNGQIYVSLLRPKQ